MNDWQTPEDIGLISPQAKLTLKVAEDDRDRVIWVTDSVKEATDRVNECEDRLITFTRIIGMKPRNFSTRPDNIASIQGMN